MVVVRAMTLVAVGVGVGLVAAAGLTRVVANRYAVTPFDPLTFTAVPAILLCVVLLACLIPAGSAARLNPVIGSAKNRGGSESSERRELLGRPLPDAGPLGRSWCDTCTMHNVQKSAVLRLVVVVFIVPAGIMLALSKRDRKPLGEAPLVDFPACRKRCDGSSSTATSQPSRR